jgi:hypothetical protein
MECGSDQSREYCRGCLLYLFVVSLKVSVPSPYSTEVSKTCVLFVRWWPYFLLSHPHMGQPDGSKSFRGLKLRPECVGTFHAFRSILTLCISFLLSHAPQTTAETKKRNDKLLRLAVEQQPLFAFKVLGQIFRAPHGLAPQNGPMVVVPTHFFSPVEGGGELLGHTGTPRQVGQKISAPAAWPAPIPPVPDTVGTPPGQRRRPKPQLVRQTSVRRRRHSYRCRGCCRCCSRTCPRSRWGSSPPGGRSSTCFPLMPAPKWSGDSKTRRCARISPTLPAW